MSKTEEKTVTVALNCSVKVSGTLYAPDDVIRVPEHIAERLIAQKAADLYEVPAENVTASEEQEGEQPDGTEDDEAPPAGAVEEGYVTAPPLDGLYRERRAFYPLRNRIVSVTSSNNVISLLRSWSWDGSPYPTHDVAWKGFPGGSAWNDLAYPVPVEGSHLLFPAVGYRRSGRDITNFRGHMLASFSYGAPYGSDVEMEPFAALSDDSHFLLHDGLLKDRTFNLPDMPLDLPPVFHKRLQIDPLAWWGSIMAGRGRLFFAFRFRNHVVYWNGMDDYVPYPRFPDGLLVPTNLPYIAAAGAFGVGIGVVEADGAPRLARLLSHTRFVLPLARTFVNGNDVYPTHNSEAHVSEFIQPTREPEIDPDSFDHLKNAEIDANGPAIGEANERPLLRMRVHGDRAYLVRGGPSPRVFRTSLWDRNAPLELVYPGVDVMDYQREGYLAVRVADGASGPVVQSRDHGQTWKQVSTSKAGRFISGALVAV